MATGSGPAAPRGGVRRRRCARPPMGDECVVRNDGFGSRLCENTNDRRQSINFSRFSGRFPLLQARLGEAKKFAPDAPFSDNFRVFTQPGSLSESPKATESVCYPR
jgi:hypothetical protein